MYLLAGQTQTYFVYAGQAAWQLAQEYDSATKVAATDPAKDSTLNREYVYGNYIDEIVQKTVDIDGDGLTVSYLGTGGVSGESSKPTTPHQDDQFTVYAVTDDLGGVVERYVYGDYGNVMIYDAADQLCDTSCIGNRHMYTGRLLDAHSGLYQYRYRYYMPSIAKFIHRDSLGTWGDMMNNGSANAYVGAKPWAYWDPMGLASICRRPLGTGGDKKPGGYPMLPNKFPVLDPLNIEPHHEQIFYGCGEEGENEGFFPEGVRPDKPGIQKDTHYTDCENFANEAAFRRAAQICASQPKFCTPGHYRLIPGFGHGNCQSFAACVRKEYRALTSPRKGECLKWRKRGGRGGGSSRRRCVEWKWEEPEFDPNPEDPCQGVTRGCA